MDWLRQRALLLLLVLWKEPIYNRTKKGETIHILVLGKKPSLIYGHLAKMTSFQFLPKDSKEPSMDDIYVGPMLLPRHSKWQLTWQQFRKQWFTHISLYLQMYSSNLCRFATMGNNGSKSGKSNFNTAWTPNNMGYLCDPTDGLNDDIGLQKLIS